MLVKTILSFTPILRMVSRVSPRYAGEDYSVIYPHFEDGTQGKPQFLQDTMPCQQLMNRSWVGRTMTFPHNHSSYIQCYIQLSDISSSSPSFTISFHLNLGWALSDSTSTKLIERSYLIKEARVTVVNQHLILVLPCPSPCHLSHLGKPGSCCK